VNGRIEGVWEHRDGVPVITAFSKLPASVRRALPPEANLVDRRRTLVA